MRKLWIFLSPSLSQSISMTDWLNSFVIGDNGGDCVLSLLPDMNADPTTVRRRRYVSHLLNFHIFKGNVFLYNHLLNPTVSVQNRSGPVWTRSAGWWDGEGRGGSGEAKFSRTGATDLQRSDQKVLSSLSRPGPGKKLNDTRSIWIRVMQYTGTKCTTDGKIPTFF